jgi:hypothetical protein
MKNCFQIEVRMMNDQMIEVTRMFSKPAFKSRTTSDVIFGPDLSDVTKLTPFPFISDLLFRIDEMGIDEKVDRFKRIDRLISDLIVTTKEATSHLNHFYQL